MYKSLFALFFHSFILSFVNLRILLKDIEIFDITKFFLDKIILMSLFDSRLYPSKIGPYLLKEQIGLGMSSIVVRVVRVNDGKEFACKILSKTYFTLTQQIKQFCDEMKSLMALQHPNIVQYVDFLEDAINYYLFQEHCVNGDMGAYIATHGPFSEQRAAQLFTQILSAVTYIHSQEIVHRDIKPENIFFDADMNCKLADFGFSSFVKKGELRKTVCGTLYYAAPEVLMNKPYDAYLADSWSCGVLLFTMVAGRVPWETKNKTALLSEIKSKPIQIPPRLSKSCTTLIRQLCEIDLTKRLTVDEALGSPFLPSDTQRPKTRVSCISANPNSFPLMRWQKSLISSAVTFCKKDMNNDDEEDVKAIEEIMHETKRLKPHASKSKLRSTFITLPKTTKVRIRSQSTDMIDTKPLFLPGWSTN